MSVEQGKPSIAIDQLRTRRYEFQKASERAGCFVGKTQTALDALTTPLTGPGLTLGKLVEVARKRKAEVPRLKSRTERVRQGTAVLDSWKGKLDGAIEVWETFPQASQRWSLESSKFARVQELAQPSEGYPEGFVEAEEFERAIDILEEERGLYEGAKVRFDDAIDLVRPIFPEKKEKVAPVVTQEPQIEYRPAVPLKAEAVSVPEEGGVSPNEAIAGFQSTMPEGIVFPNTRPGKVIEALDGSDESSALPLAEIRDYVFESSDPKDNESTIKRISDAKKILESYGKTIRSYNKDSTGKSIPGLYFITDLEKKETTPQEAAVEEVPVEIVPEAPAPVVEPSTKEVIIDQPIVAEVPVEEGQPSEEIEETLQTFESEVITAEPIQEETPVALSEEEMQRRQQEETAKRHPALEIVYVADAILKEDRKKRIRDQREETPEEREKEQKLQERLRPHKEGLRELFVGRKRQERRAYQAAVKQKIGELAATEEGTIELLDQVEETNLGHVVDWLHTRYSSQAQEPSMQNSAPTEIAQQEESTVTEQTPFELARRDKQWVRHINSLIDRLSGSGTNNGNGNGDKRVNSLTLCTTMSVRLRSLDEAMKEGIVREVGRDGSHRKFTPEQAVKIAYYLKFGKAKGLNKELMDELFDPAYQRVLSERAKEKEAKEEVM